MRYPLLALLFFFASTAHAYVPEVVVPSDVDDIREVVEPEALTAYHGELLGFPHTYEIRTTESFVLYAHILEPDTEEATENHAGIIVRVRDNGRGVEEVARLIPSIVAWEPFYEFVVAERYRSGPEYETEIGPGVYRVEVSTPTNEGKYVLVIGKGEESSRVGYFGTLKRIYEVKQFFGKVPVAMVLSPYVYIPLIFMIIMFFIGRFMYKRRYG